MTQITNPRFPHYCRIIRYVATEPMEDQANVLDPIVDEDPMTDEDSDVSGTNENDGSNESSGSDEVDEQDEGKKVIYEGICRSYNRDTISDNGEVIASYRNLALPLKQDEWTEETIPAEGDKIEVERFGYKEYGQVIDRRPSNLGTHILWKYVRN